MTLSVAAPSVCAPDAVSTAVGPCRIGFILLQHRRPGECDSQLYQLATTLLYPAALVDALNMAYWRSAAPSYSRRPRYYESIQGRNGLIDTLRRVLPGRTIER